MFLLFGLIFITLFSAKAFALINVTACQALNSSGETYNLMNNITAGGDCFTITASNVTLDCQSHQIYGLSSVSAGAFVGASNFTIRNCIINNYGDGINFVGSISGGLVENNIITGSTFSDACGIFDEHCGNTIRNNIFYNNSNAVCYHVSVCSNDHVYNNLFNGTIYYDGVGGELWNTTEQSGTRIFGNGDMIGGNYWTNSSSDGYSDICTDANHDGFCDSAYSIPTVSGVQYDYLPLSDEYVPDVVNITDCQALSVSNRTYHLTSDIVNSSATTCMNIQGNDIIFNCQGHLIEGIDSNPSTGVLANGRNNITLEDCVIKDWRKGVDFGNTDNSNLYNLDVSGVYRTAWDSGTGINLNGDENITAENITAYSYAHPFRVDWNANVLFDNINISYVGNRGMWGQGNNNLTLQDSSIYGNIDFSGGWDVINCSATNENIKIINNDVYPRLAGLGAKGGGIRFAECTFNSQISYNRIYGRSIQVDLGMVPDNSEAQGNITISNNTFSPLGTVYLMSAGVLVRNNSWTIADAYDSWVIGIWGSVGQASSHDIDESNLVNGKPIKYFASQSNVQFDSSPYSEVMLINCSNVTAHNGDLVGSIELDYTNDSTIRDLTSTSLYGVFLMNSFGNKIYNVTLRGNGAPLDIELSNDNEVYNSIIENPTADLLYFYESYNNTIYNNLMNSSSFYFDGVDANSWNTTQQSGTRIYTDGNQIGGNYWTNSTGNGFSDTCADNNTDGFCDDPYVMDANETDYLPLSNQYLVPSVPNCMVLNQTGTAYLNSDIIDSNAYACINITANDVVLDCQGHTVDANYTNANQHWGVYSVNTSNITVENCIFSDWYEAGIGFDGVDGGLITGNTFDNSSQDSSYASVELSELGSPAQSVVVSFNNFINNPHYDIDVGTNITMYDNYFVGGITYVEYNVTSAFWNIFEGGEVELYTSGNQFYNNIFNDTQFTLGSTSNYWNTTQQPASRIYSNGNEIGGNYWTNSTGNDYSDTCIDTDRNGFCDSPFDLNAWSSCTVGVDCSNNTDYLPLSNRYVSSVPSAGTGAIISDIGNGLGGFLSAIYLPLGNFILYLGIIFGVIAIFMGIAYVVKLAIEKHNA